MEIHPHDTQSHGSQTAATGDPRGHGKEPAAHLQTAVNHKSYLSVPLLSFRGWLSARWSAGGSRCSTAQEVWEPLGKAWGRGLGNQREPIVPLGWQRSRREQPPAQDWAREMFGGVCSSSASLFRAHLFTLWASPSCCDGPLRLG